MMKNKNHHYYIHLHHLNYHYHHHQQLYHLKLQSILQQIHQQDKQKQFSDSVFVLAVVDRLVVLFGEVSDLFQILFLLLLLLVYWL